jgi:hypothetical protein
MTVTNKQRWCIGTFCLLCLSIAALVVSPNRFPSGTILLQRLRGQATVSDRLAQYGPAARARWQPYFEKQGVAYPPQKILLGGLKREKRLEVYAADAGRPFRFIRALPIRRMSGKLGPKLRYGDYQVPEGFYRVASLNPNSAFHVALRVDYPNAFDRSQAQREGRADLSGGIMIHGSDASVGCLAMGDETAEDLFVLAAETGPDNVDVILSPVDFRVAQEPADPTRLAWVSGLYTDIGAALRALPQSERGT